MQSQLTIVCLDQWLSTCGSQPLCHSIGRLRVTGLDDVDGHIQDTTKAAAWLAKASYTYRTKSDITTVLLQEDPMTK